MFRQSLQLRSPGHAAMLATRYDFIACDWQALRQQLLSQWARISPRELDETGPTRHGLAELVAHKYGISTDMVENYLTNFERTMPLAALQ